MNNRVETGLNNKIIPKVSLFPFHESMASRVEKGGINLFDYDSKYAFIQLSPSNGANVSN